MNFVAGRAVGVGIEAEKAAVAGTTADAVAVDDYKMVAEEGEERAAGLVEQGLTRTCQD